MSIYLINSYAFLFFFLGLSSSEDYKEHSGVIVFVVCLFLALLWPLAVCYVIFSKWIKV